MANPQKSDRPDREISRQEISDQEIFAQEHARRQRHLLSDQEDELLNRLTDSPGYVATSTPAGRIAMQRLLNKLHGE